MSAKKKLKSYIVLGTDKDGKYVGYVEHSFSMGLSTERVRVERPYEYKEETLKKYGANSSNALMLMDLNTIIRKLNSDKYYIDKGITFKLYRVGTKSCPVKIDWREIVAMKSGGKYDKFKYRNLPFSIKVV